MSSKMTSGAAATSTLAVTTRVSLSAMPHRIIRLLEGRARTLPGVASSRGPAILWISESACGLRTFACISVSGRVRFEHTFYSERRHGMTVLDAPPLPLDPSLPVPVAMVVAGLDAMAAKTPADIPPTQALLEAQVLLVQADRMRALALARVADVENRQLYALDD